MLNGDVIQPLGQPEVGQPDAALVVQQQVRGFDIAMDDAALMCVRESFGRLQAPLGTREFRTSRGSAVRSHVRTSARLRPSMNCIA